MKKMRTSYVLNWVSLNFCKNNLKSSNSPVSATGSYSYYIPPNPRFYSPKRAATAENTVDLHETNSLERENRGKISPAALREAQAALLEYLHCTRSLQFMDAEYMSRNSPIFIEKLLKRINNEDEENIGRSITRFLRYHPINEFEPFFESIGLKPYEYSAFLPRNLMFLNDDKKLLENYYALCTYGFARDSIGKIYKEVEEIFRYDYGVLLSKLQSFEKVGLPQSTVIKIVASSPHVLIGNASKVLLRVLEKLKSIGFDFDWIEGKLLEVNSYNWDRMLELLCLLNKIGFNKDQLRGLINQTPGLLFDESGTKTITIIGFLIKFGATKNEISLAFINFPQIEVEKYFLNLRQCYNFLIELEMRREEIGRIVRSHTGLLGSCYLKKLTSLLQCLSTGKKRICQIIIENPEELKNWVFGSRVHKLPNMREGDKILVEKNKFLIRLGFEENSIELKKALKLFRGRAEELQERFDCLINAGLTQSDVSVMLKTAPQIINQRKELIEMKIDFLVNELGYPVSTLIVFPAYISYTMQRVSLRCSMYDWLKDERKVEPDLALSTIVACSDKIFLKQYVNQHPNGLLVWEKLKKQIYSE